MEPLSAAGSIVGLIGACSQIGQYTVSLIKTLRDAPTELIQLSNEVNDLNAILNELHLASLADTSRRNGPPTAQQGGVAQNEVFAMQLSCAKKQVIELDAFIKSLKTHSQGNGQMKVDRLGWARKKKFARKTQERLAEIKRNLHIFLDADTASRVCRVESAVQDVLTDIAVYQTKTEAKLDLLFQQIQPTPAPDPQAENESIDAESITENATSPPMCTPPPTVRQASLEGQHHNNIMTFQFQEGTPVYCDDLCDCICHLRNRSWWRSPLILRNVVGFFSLNYSSLWILKPACTSARCRSYSTRVFKATFCLPRWFLAKAAHVAARMTPHGDPYIALTIQRRTAEFTEDSIFELSLRGDVAGIENLIKRRIASPNDAGDHSGCTALHWAVGMRKIGAVRLLLSCGANPDLEDDYGFTAVQVAWEAIFLQKHNLKAAEDLKEFKTVFPESQSIGRFDFSDVHKVVLNIYPLKIERMLLKQNWRLQINFADAFGRTPLHWAVRRNDATAVETLISAGANVDIPDLGKQAPLHLAASIPNDNCLQLLLRANADVMVKDINGVEPIHIAARSGIPHLQALLTAGSSLESERLDGRTRFSWRVQGCYGWGTPLNFAVCHNKVAAGRFLISIGANKDYAEKIKGNTPLFTAIWFRNSECLDMLIANGANIKHINRSGSTLLHETAQNADCAVLNTLVARKHLLKGLNTGHKNCAGKTARDVLRDRLSKPDGFEDEFERFISSLEEDETQHIDDAQPNPT